AIDQSRLTSPEIQVPGKIRERRALPKYAATVRRRINETLRIANALFFAVKIDARYSARRCGRDLRLRDAHARNRFLQCRIALERRLDKFADLRPAVSMPPPTPATPCSARPKTDVARFHRMQLRLALRRKNAPAKKRDYASCSGRTNPSSTTTSVHHL